MAKPKQFFLGDDSAGIDVTFTRSRMNISIGGWFDHCVGIRGDNMPLGDFLERLGITLKDCEKAIKEWSERDGV